MRITTACSAICMALGLLALAAPARAGLVTWDVDPAQSFMRLTIADQAIPVEGVGNVTIRLRDATSTSSWTDAGGRRAFLDGTLSTNLIDTISVQFNSGSHNLFALEQTNLRPNPAQFTGPADADNPDGTYVGTGTAPAAFGARVRGSASILTFDAAFLAIRDAFLDIASGAIALGGGTTIAGNTTNVGIASASIDVDGLALPLGLGQAIPDIFNETIGLGTLANTTGGSIVVVGGPGSLDRMLTLTVTVPIALDVEGILINGSATGTIVAFATIPEPSSVLLASFAAFGLMWAGRRRFRRS